MFSEATTRKNQIDVQLASAAWAAGSRRVLSEFSIQRAWQIMFVRTLRKAIMQRAEIASVDALRQAPFTAIGDPETLFSLQLLNDMLALTRQLAAA